VVVLERAKQCTRVGTREARAIAFSPDGRYLVGASVQPQALELRTRAAIVLAGDAAGVVSPIGFSSALKKASAPSANDAPPACTVRFDEIVELLIHVAREIYALRRTHVHKACRRNANSRLEFL
jgi:hypothetical protein